MQLTVLIIIAYLIGSIATAIIVAKLLSLPDPRLMGSGNPGATNMLRLSGKKVGIIVLLGDTVKGVLPIIAAYFLNIPTYLMGWIGLAVFIGHIFPLFFKFKGGKGVATALGVLLVLSWKLGLITLVIWIGVVGLTRYVSLGSILSALISSLLAFWIIPENALPILIMSILLIIRHSSNIQRLMKGLENKFQLKKMI